MGEGGEVGEADGEEAVPVVDVVVSATAGAETSRARGSPSIEVAFG